MNKLHDNVEKYLTSGSRTGTIDETSWKMLKTLNDTIIGAYAPLFYPEGRAHMHATEMTFQDKPVKVENFDLASFSLEEYNQETVFRKVIAAIRDQWYDLKTQGKRFLPFIPVAMRMEIDRNTFSAIRTFVTRGAVVDDVPGPYGTPLHPSEYKPLLDNVRSWSKMSLSAEPNAKLTEEIVVAINTKLLERYGHELFNEPARYMVGPTGMFGGVAIAAATRKLKPELEVTDIDDMREQIDKLVDDVAFEFMQERDIVADQGNAVYPYIPIASSGIMMNPNTYTPFMTFSTRYGMGKDCI